MSLGLGHSLSRFKLKFSTDKVDIMVIQAIALLDDLDKEINIYSMRVKVCLAGCGGARRSFCIRNGTDGTFQRWAKSSSTISRMLGSSNTWVSVSSLVCDR